MRKVSDLVTLATLASAAALYTGCNTVQNTTDKLRTIGYADTNTIPLRSGTEDYSFRKARIGEIFAENDTYALVPMENNSTVRVNGKTLDQRVILAARFIPHGNSTYIRTEKKVTVKDNGQRFYGVNASADANGKLNINEGQEEQASFFIISHNTFPQKVEADQLKIVQQRILEKVKKESGYVQIRGEKYISLPADNPFGPDRVFIPLERAKPVYYERRSPAGITVQFGLQGPGYFLTEGTEIAAPIDTTNPQGAKVIKIAPKVD